MAQKTFEDQVKKMGQEELEDLKEIINERIRELKRESAKEIMKMITIGSKVRFDKGEGIVDVMSSEYVGIKGEEGKRNRRLAYEDILEVIEE